MIKLFRLIECVMLAFFFGLIPPMFFLLATVIIAAVMFGTKALGPWALWSLVPAIAIDVILLKKWIGSAYQMSSRAIASVYLFYSIVTLGMCMGMPIGSFTLGIVAGPYAARRMQLARADEQKRKRYFKKTAFFCASVMALMCCLITLWAAVGGLIGAQVETPILSFTMTVPAFVTIVLAGAAAAIMLQYIVTLVALKLTSRLLSHKSPECIP